MSGKARLVCYKFSLLTLLLLLSACNIRLDSLPSARVEAPTEAIPRSGWHTIASGLDWREVTPENDGLGQLKILRIDPQKYSFRVVYSPGEPLSLAQWRAQEPNVIAIVNANFFDPAHFALGLVISDGVSYGSAYLERGGTFLVMNGKPAVRGNRAMPYRVEEAAVQAVQGFPILVENGKQAYFGQPNQQRTRRTAIAEDAEGNILLISAPFLGPTLGDLSAYLAESDLNIESAFNLDGGGSAMMAVYDIDYFQPSLDAVPAILVVYKR